MEETSRAVVVFSAPLTCRLSTNQVRLPPTYIGVRRLRPSSRTVQNATKSTMTGRSSVVYKVIGEDGIERRMTSQEKKKRRMELLEEKKQQKKLSNMMEAREDKYNEAAVSSVSVHGVSNKNYQLQVKKQALEEELSDQRGEGKGVSPCCLSPPLARQALVSGILTSTHVGDAATSPSRGIIVFDDVLAQEWAISLKANMSNAEAVRQKEDMRAMVYEIVPKVWTRFRPKSLLGSTEGPAVHEFETGKKEFHSGDISCSSDMNERDWDFVTIRPPCYPFDSDIQIVTDLLHQRTQLHVTCGAKFGCDLLLYDGPRIERHGFAGIRLCGSIQIADNNKIEFPLPNAYNLSGYVRCLNTAGKLALLVAVKRESTGKGHHRFRVAFVDLVLERVAGTFTDKKPKKSHEDRYVNLNRR